MKNRTRVMAFVLTVVLCVSMSATGVYAEEDATNILETTVEQVEEVICEKHEETDIEKETEAEETAEDMDEESIEETEEPCVATEVKEIAVIEPVATGINEKTVSVWLDESTSTAIDDKEDAVGETNTVETEGELEGVSFQSIATELDSAEEDSEGVILVDEPEIWNGETDETCEVLVQYEIYYSKAFDVLELINKERAAYGLPEVVMDESLMDTAIMRAVETAIYWGHVRPNNQSFRTANETMIRPSGENIGRGCIYPEEMVAGWMSSTGHAANILKEDDVSMGIACIYVDGVILWVMDCSSYLYKEVTCDGYTDGEGSMGIHTVVGLVEDDTSVTATDNIISPEQTSSISVMHYSKIAEVTIGLPPEGLVLTSSDESVCTISSDGTITGVGEGTATITAYYPGYEEGAWEISVTVCEHEYSSEVTTTPTCNAYGEETFTCTKCGDTYTQRINLADHTFGEGVVTTEMSCMSSGVMTYTCEVCGHKKTETIEAPYEHSYDSGVVTVAPTCISKGTRTYTCTVCGATKTSSIGYGSAYHGYDEGVVTSEPSCSSTGILTSTCIYCGKTKTTRIAKTDHNYDEGVVTKEVSCTEDGVMTYTCGSCGTTKTETIESNGEHNYSEVTWSSASCESGGVEKRACACGATTMVTVSALGHDIEEYAGKEATCTESGYEAYETCSRCDYSTYKEAPATGHKYDSGKTTKNATCTETGTETYTCTSCGNSYTEELSALGHETAADEAVAPSCETSGLTAGSHCSRCEIVLEAQETVDATGHTWDDGVVSKQATTTETGIMTYTCSVCGDTKEESIPCIEEAAFLRGDVDENGTVDIIDCVRIVRYITGYNVKINLNAADMTGDGSINTFDVVRLMKYIAGYDV